MKNINLENAWCKTTQENYDALIKLGYEPSDNIVNAFREDFETHLRVESDTVIWGHKKCIGAMINPDYWSKDREIHLVNGEFQYVETKPKNNFKEYGFEADFEGAILSDIEGYYVGYYVESYPCIKEKQKIPTFWNKNTGNCYKGAGVSNSKFSLKPIKKEWYEKEDNFEIAVRQIKRLDVYTPVFGQIQIMQKITNDEGDCLYFLASGGQVLEHRLQCYRPATKEEVLSLLVKE